MNLKQTLILISTLGLVNKTFGFLISLSVTVLDKCA